MAIHPTALIGAAASIDPSAEIGAFTVVHDNVEIGARCVVGSHCELGVASDLSDGSPLVVGADALIRSHSVFYAGSSFGEGLVTGHRVTVREPVVRAARAASFASRTHASRRGARATVATRSFPRHTFSSNDLPQPWARRPTLAEGSTNPRVNEPLAVRPPT